LGTGSVGMTAFILAAQAGRDPDSPTHTAWLNFVRLQGVLAAWRTMPLPLALSCIDCCRALLEQDPETCREYAKILTEK